MATINNFVVHYLMRSTTTAPLDGKEAIFVEYGLARFVETDKPQAVKIDEPLVLLAAIKWMESNHQTIHKTLSQEKSTRSTDSISNGFENYIAFCLGVYFSKKRRLSDVFEFHGEKPAWADLEAELVALHRPSPGNVEISIASFSDSRTPSVTLGTNAHSAREVLSWLKHTDKMRSPFCFPQASMGPDLIFILQLSDDSLIWVAVQGKHSGKPNDSLGKELLLKAMRSVTPSKFFLFQVSILWYQWFCENRC